MADEEKQGTVEGLNEKEQKEQSPIQQYSEQRRNRILAAWENCRRELEIRNRDLHDFLAELVDDI